MATKKISELEENTDIQNGCCFPIVSDNKTKKITFATIKAKIDSILGISSHISNKSNPHSVTPAQIGTYSNKTIDGLLETKVDKESSKGLSTNDFTDADKTAIEKNAADIKTKVDKESGKGLSTNDFTDADKAAIAKNTADIKTNTAAINKANSWNLIPTEYTTIADYILTLPVGNHKLFYRNASDTHITDMPANANMFIDVLKYSSTTIRINAYPSRQVADTIYSRSYSGGSWGNWYKFAAVVEEQTTAE